MFSHLSVGGSIQSSVTGEAVISHLSGGGSYQSFVRERLFQLDMIDMAFFRLQPLLI